MKAYLYLEPYVYLSLAGDSVLLYNTLSSSCYTFNNGSLCKIFQQFSESSNRVLPIELESYHKDPDWSRLISWIKDSFSGDLIPMEGRNLPFITKPNLEPFSEPEIIESKLINLTIYLDSTCSLDCPYCGKYHKQLTFCKKSNKRQSIDFKRLAHFISELSERIESIHIVCNQISTITTGLKLLDAISNLDCDIMFYIHLRNLLSVDRETIQAVFSKKTIILADSYYDRDILLEYIDYINHVFSKHEYHIVVRDLHAMLETDSDDIRYFPFYDNNNRSFFEDAVCISEDDIILQNLSMNDIYNRTHMNTFFWGKLIVDSDGDLFVSFMDDKLDNVNQVDVRYLLSSLTNDESLWKRLRRDVEICDQCLYNSLCPSISNYELAMNRYDLCKIGVI